MTRDNHPLCPTCRRPVESRLPKIWPFCSERCKLVDLGRWAKEEYRIPVAQGPDATDTMGAMDEENDDSDLH